MELHHRAPPSHRRAAPRAPAGARRRGSGAAARAAARRRPGHRGPAMGGEAGCRVARAAAGAERDGASRLLRGPLAQRHRATAQHPARHGQVAVAACRGAAAFQVRRKMNPPTHHLTDEWLVDYAAGAASEPVALLVATHLAYCPACRAAHGKLEAVGGALLNDIAPAEVSASAWSRLEALLDEPPQPTKRVAADAAVPTPLRRYAPQGLDALR